MINEKADQILYLMAHAMLIHLRDRNHDTPTLISQAKQTSELANGIIGEELQKGRRPMENVRYAEGSTIIPRSTNPSDYFLKVGGVGYSEWEPLQEAISASIGEIVNLRIDGKRKYKCSPKLKKSK
jgi:hypothetical protein